MNRIVVIQSFIIGFSCVACAPALDSHLDIVGGEVVSREHPLAHHVVALTQTNGRILCSGVLLTEGIVLTAAHCLPNLRMIWRPTISFSTVGENSWDSATSSPNPKVRRVSRVLYHSGYNSEAMDDEPREAPNDIGLVFYDGETPSPYTHANFEKDKTTAIEPDVTEGNVFGFGVTSTSGQDAGVLRSVWTAPGRWFLEVGLVQYGPHEGRGACFGDSGGPVFDSHGVVTGLVSYGPEEGEEGPNCESGRFYVTDLESYRYWVESNAGVSLSTGERIPPSPGDSTGFALMP